MRFKIDENLPVEVAGLLVSAGHDAPTVREQGLNGEDDRRVADVCIEESRALVTLRVRQQDKPHLLAVLQRVLPLLEREPLEHRLWIVDEVEVRIRQ